MPLIRRAAPWLLTLCLGAQAQEPVLLSLQEAEAKEVQARGFTLPRPMKVHVYARGTAAGRMAQGPFTAYGWILNAATREVVWQMDGRTSRPQRSFEVADAYLDLPAGSYEVYYTNHAYSGHSLFSTWTVNLDRRHLPAEEGRRHRGFLEGLRSHEVDRWRREVGWYGLQLSLAGGRAEEVGTFQAPLHWPLERISLTGLGDGDRRTRAFHLSRPVTLHLYAQGERSGERRFADTAWIQDVRTGKVVWSLDGAKAQYAGGATKNRRQVETITLPAGDYEAGVATDESHSPADWNGAPPCDPLLYGLTVSLTQAADATAFSERDHPRTARVLAELVRVGHDQDLRRDFELRTATSVRILALGEGEGDEEMADFGWLEDAQGKTLWALRLGESVPAGGASKNRQAEAVLTLPKGRYTLRYRSDGSHAYGDWNSAPPKEADRYGITVFAADGAAGPDQKGRPSS